MDKRLMHYAFPRDQIQLDGTMAELPQKIAAAVEDTTDAVIVKAVQEAARAEEVTDLYLLDRKFVLDAIREKRERENPKPQTNGDRIRSMSDEELADIMIGQDEMDERIHFCQNLPECSEWLETPEGVPEHKCKDCLLKWLQQPAKEE